MGSRATPYSGAGPKSGGFVDYSHSPAAGTPSSATIPGYTKAGSCGFIDCDHAPGSGRS